MKYKKLKKHNPFENIETIECENGENILTKVRRILDENEPLTDGAPLIYTSKKDGVRPEYDIRTDKWNIAMEAMDRVNAYKISEYLKTGEPMETSKGETEPTTTNKTDSAA